MWRFNLTPLAAAGVQTLRDERIWKAVHMAGANTDGELVLQLMFCRAVEDTLRTRNADGLRAVLTSPLVCLFSQCATINAGSALLKSSHSSLLHGL